MVKLRRITEATDSSHTSIMYNLADTLKRRGIEAVYVGDKGIRIDFTLNKDPRDSKEGKDWLEKNKGKDFVFKGNGLEGQLYWDIIKGNDGKRQLITKDVAVKGEKDLRALQKKLKIDGSDKGKLTGRSAKLFEYPEPYTITNLATPTFQSFLKRLYSKILNEIGLALSEVVEVQNVKNEIYFIDYDEEFNRIDEGYITEADDKEKKVFSWKDEDVQKAVVDSIKGMEIDKSKTTDKELIFKFNGKNGSLHLQGYMLVLDTDTDDKIPPTSYPVKDKGNLKLDNLLETIKTVFSRRESKKEEPKEEKRLDEENQKEEKTESLDTVENKDSEELKEESISEDDNKEEKIESVDAAENKEAEEQKEADFNEENKEEVTQDLPEDKGELTEVEESKKDNSNEDLEVVTESVEEHIDGVPNFRSSLVFQDITKERFFDQIKDSLIVAPEFKGDIDIERIKDPIWVFLSPSYAISQISHIVVPVMIHDRKVSLPVADIPEPSAVFDGEYTEDALADYGMAVQEYLLKDAPISEVLELDIDNSEEAKTLVVDLINRMAEDYQAKREQLANSLDLEGEDLLKESRYFIVPEDTDLTKEVNKINQVGYTDLGLAKKDLEEMIDSGQFPYSLRILDTNFSKNKEKWTLL